MAVEDAGGTRVGRPIRAAFVRDAGVLSLAQAFKMVLSVAQIAIVARALGVSGLGILSIALALPALVLGILDANSGEAVVRYVARYGESARGRPAAAVIRLALAADVAAIVVAVPVLALVVAAGLGGSVAGDMFALGMVAVALGSPTSTARAALTGVGAFKATALCDVATSVLALGAVGAAATRGSVTAFLLAYIASAAFGLVVVGGVATRCLDMAGVARWWRVRTGELGDSRRQVLRFMVATDVTAALSTVVREVDVLIVGSVVGVAGAGAYRLAKSAVTPIGALVGSLQAALFPRISASTAVWDRLIRPRSAVVMGGAVAGLIVGCIGVLLAPVGVRLLGGDEFAGAVTAARWAIAGGAVVLALFWVRPALLSSGEVRYLVLNSTATAAISLVAMYAGARVSGVAGVAAARALVASAGGSSVAAVHILRRRPHLADAKARHPIFVPESTEQPPYHASQWPG